MTTTLLAARQVEVAEVARLKRLETSAPSRNLHIAVTDTGIGLTASDTTRVFEHFYRVANVPRPPGGTGIGLSIAQRFARLHGGDLTCTSPGLGHGTTFTLTLP